VLCVAPSTSTITFASKQTKSITKRSIGTCRRNLKPRSCRFRRCCQSFSSALVCERLRRAPKRSSQSPFLRLRLQLVAQLLLLVLDEPADHLPPKRLAEVRRNAAFGGAGSDAIDDLLIAPGDVGLLLGSQLELPGPLHVAEALRDQVDERGVEPVYLSAHLAHVGAIFRSTRAHRPPPVNLSATIDRAR